MEDDHIFGRRFHATVTRQVIALLRLQTLSVRVQIGWQNTAASILGSIPNAFRSIPY